MNVLKLIKCLLCLVKCSKYLYFIKKIICICAVILTGVFLLGMIPFDKKLLKKIGRKL